MADTVPQPVSFDDLADSIKSDALERRQAQLEGFREYSPTDIVDFLSAALLATDTVMNGVGMASHITALDGIMTSALDRSREAIEGAIKWIEATAETSETSAGNEEAAPVTKAAAKVRVVYGQTDDSDF